MAAVQSAVRVPSPEPGDDEPTPERETSRKRSLSRSPSRRGDAKRRSFSRSPPPRDGPRNRSLPKDVDRSRAIERARQLEMRQKEETEPAKPMTAEEKQASAKAEYDRLINMRSGGTYIPPARLRALQSQITDKTSKEYQRLQWEALKKAINGLTNKVSEANIKHIVPELFSENLVRGRGLFCRSIMKAQSVSLPFTPIYAAMVAVVNTKLPQIGELLTNRLIANFKKSYRRNDKAVCLSSTTFLAHLINQQVVHEMLAAQILLILLKTPTDDSVEIAVGLMKEVGAHIEEMNSQIALAVYDQFRSILHEADIDKRTQYMIEVLFEIRKNKYKDHQSVKDELDLVEEEDQITHRPDLNDPAPTEDMLNVFKFDSDWEANEEAYKKLKAEILGEASDSEEEDGDDAEFESSESEEDEAEKAMEIKDQSNTDLVNLRRSIYLTIMSSGGFEEACHKLMRINLPTGREDELPSMIIECCSQERTYNKFFGMIGERFCKLNRLWRDLFEEMFAKYYDTIHRYETNRLRIIAQFFGHLLSSDAIGWHVFNAVKLNEEDTTSSSRIFIKILIEDLAQGVGMKSLAERFKAEELQPALTGMFSTDNPKNTRFSINFFTAIGMGVLTEGMREFLKNMPKPEPAPLPEAKRSPSRSSRSDSRSSYSSYSSYSSRSDSRGRSRSRTPSRRRRDDSMSRSRSREPARKGRGRSPSWSRSPPRRRARSYSTDSRSPPPKRSRRYSDSRSPSRSPRRRPGRKDVRSDNESRSPPRRRRYSSSGSRSPPRKPANGRRRSPSNSRSPSPRRGRSYTRSRSPPRANGKARDRRDSPPRKRGRSDSRSSYSSYSSNSRSRTPPRRSAPAPKRLPPPAKRRRNTTSPEISRSRSPPPRRSAPAPAKDKERGARSPPSTKRRRNTSSPETSREREPPRKKPVVEKPKEDGEGKEEDLSHIHPSRRGLMGAGTGQSADGAGRGGRGGRAKASDFM